MHQLKHGGQRGAISGGAVGGGVRRVHALDHRCRRPVVGLVVITNDIVIMFRRHGGVVAARDEGGGGRAEGGMRAGGLQKQTQNM
jgi:hypothetical protein